MTNRGGGELVVIFRTPSQIEATVIQGLLDTHDIPSALLSDNSRTAFPLALNDQAWERRVAVSPEDADAAVRIIASHRDDVPGGRVVPFGSELEPLERLIGYRFKDRGLLEHALTHRSRVHEDASGGVFDNESMEFLGDSVLGFVIAAMLFREFPQHNEGQKSKLKASLVSAASLARLAERLSLGEFLILGRGEEKTGGRRKHAIIADCYEALIAAIYLDGGVEPVQRFIEQQFQSLIEAARHSGTGASFTDDWKSALQEFLQSTGRGLPAYRLAGEIGPDHRKSFVVEVIVEGEAIASAEGRSKKEAAQTAAKAALEKLSA
jgi:ribonuclease-3